VNLIITNGVIYLLENKIWFSSWQRLNNLFSHHHVLNSPRADRAWDLKVSFHRTKRPKHEIHNLTTCEAELNNVLSFVAIYINNLALLLKKKCTQQERVNIGCRQTLSSFVLKADGKGHVSELA